MTERVFRRDEWMRNIGHGFKQRFSNRVEDYVRYRPGYPRAIVDLLRDECGLTPESVVADVGSGTGLLTQLFLENGNVVYGSRAERRDARGGRGIFGEISPLLAASRLGGSHNAAGCERGLRGCGAGVSLVRPQAARAEFRAHAEAGGWVAVIWNERKKDATALLRDYETLLQTYGTDYEQVASKYPERSRMEEFFGPRP